MVIRTIAMRKPAGHRDPRSNKIAAPMLMISAITVIAFGDNGQARASGVSQRASRSRHGCINPDCSASIDDYGVAYVRHRIEPGDVFVAESDRKSTRLNS